MSITVIHNKRQGLTLKWSGNEGEKVFVDSADGRVQLDWSPIDYYCTQQPVAIGRWYFSQEKYLTDRHVEHMLFYKPENDDSYEIDEWGSYLVLIKECNDLRYLKFKSDGTTNNQKISAWNRGQNRYLVHPPFGYEEGFEYDINGDGRIGFGQRKFKVSTESDLTLREGGFTTISIEYEFPFQGFYDSRQIGWEISGDGINADDFDLNAMEGKIDIDDFNNVSNGSFKKTATVSISVSEDSILEGVESGTISFYWSEGFTQIQDGFGLSPWVTTNRELAGAVNFKIIDSESDIDPDPTSNPNPNQTTPGASPEDLDNDGFVDKVSNYQLLTSSGGVDLTNRRGRNFSDNTSRMWNAEKAVQTDTGFTILIKHERKDGKYKVWEANTNGTVTSQSRWKSGDQLVTEGYEDIFTLDLNGDSIVGKPVMQDNDGDGFVDGVLNYQVYTTDDRDLFLRNRNGRRIFSDQTSRQWDAVKVVIYDSSIQTLIEGTARKEGKYKIWTSRQSNGNLMSQTRWQTGDALTSEGYESVFNYDINDNGVIGD